MTLRKASVPLFANNYLDKSSCHAFCLLKGIYEIYGQLRIVRRVIRATARTILTDYGRTDVCVNDAKVIAQLISTTVIVKDAVTSFVSEQNAVNYPSRNFHRKMSFHRSIIREI